MELTPEQINQLQLQTEPSIIIENARVAGQIAVQTFQARLEAVRLAKEILLENARSKTASERDVAAEDVIAYANDLITFIKS